MPLDFFAFYPGAWLADPKVRAMSFERRGVYFELLCLSWTYSSEGCYLPDDAAFIASLLAMPTHCWEAMRTDFVDSPRAVFLSVEGMLINKRLRREWEKAHDKAGRMAQLAQKRWQKDPNLHDSNAYALQEQHSIGNAALSDETQKKNKNKNKRESALTRTSPPSKKDAPTPIPQAKMTAMKEAIKAALGWTHTPSRTEWGVLQKVAKELLDCGIAPEDMPLFVQLIWDRQAWRTTLTAGELPKLVHVYRDSGPRELTPEEATRSVEGQLIEDEALWGKYKA